LEKARLIEPGLPVEDLPHGNQTIDIDDINWPR
jgi:hypothetical protein